MHITKSLSALFKFTKTHCFISNETKFFDWFHSSTVLLENKFLLWSDGGKKKALDEMEKKMQFGVLRTYVSMSHNI